MQRQVNDITLAYDKTGNGPALVLCHSLGMNRKMWFQQVPAFSQRYQVLTFDARGHGESSKPAGPYTIEQMGEDVYGLLKAEGITRTAVFGLSMGGNTAQAIAVNHSDLVQALILCDTTAWYGADAEKNWEARASEVAASGMASIINFSLSRWFSDGFRASRPDLMKQLADWLTANDVGGYTATQRALGKIDLRGRVDNISCPTLVIVGEHDPATPPAMARDLHERIKGSKLLVLPEAKHMSPVERADDVNKAVLEFLAQAGY